jgi:hypothetical protein
MASPQRKQQEASEFVVPEDEKALVAWLERKRQRGRKQLPDLQMKLNLSYVLGQQWVVWDEKVRAFRKAENRSDDPNAPVRITANKIGGIVERFIARLTRSAPTPETRPVSDDESDINAAKAGTRILRSELNRLEWDSWLVRHYFWVVTHGWAYAQIMWDPSKGSVVGQVDDVDVKMGDITLESVPGHELSVDPSALDMRGAKWAVRTRTMTQEDIWETWGVQATGAAYERSITDEVLSLTASGRMQDSSVDTVAVHQFWMVPCRAAPKGLVVTWAGNTILEPPRPFPYKHGRLPFVQYDLLPGLGRREGRTWVDDLLSLQADYNDARSREAALRRTLTPKLAVPAGSIDTSRLTSRVEVIPYNPVGDRPVWIIPDSGWAGQHEASMNRADMEMGDRAGQSDVSSGKPYSASMPAAAILALQEADDTKLAITYKLMSDAIEQTAWHILELVRQFWTEDRLVSTWSEEGALEVKHFSGADIENQLDVHVSTDTGVVRSKSAMVQLVFDLVDRGIITDPRHVLRLIQVPGTDFIAESFNIDTRQAQRENEYLLLGEPVEIHSFDNHMVHISEHDNIRKSEEYDKLQRRAAAGDPEATQIIANLDAHTQAHYEMVLPQLGIPTPPGTEQQVGPLTGPMGGSAGGGSDYLDPRTGLPPNPTMVAAGQSPSALDTSTVAKRAGIGGPGEPGRVQGTSIDEQAARLGR